MLDSDDRPWGRWEEYLNESGYRVKRLLIHPGKRFSLQKHAHRSEYWVVVKGTGILTLANERKRIAEGEAAVIPVGTVHRLENDGPQPLVVIETQMGLCLEDDIERLEDDWDRK